MRIGHVKPVSEKRLREEVTVRERERERVRESPTEIVAVVERVGWGGMGV
jgi:hypothetical protein